MRIIFLLLLLSFTGKSQSAAQSMTPQEGRSFGFRLGLNSSNTNFNKGYPPPAAFIKTSRKTGIVFGFLMEVPLAGNLFLQPEYLYSQMGGKVDSSGAVYKFSYASLPVFLKYKSGKLSISAGPQFDLLLKAKKNMNGTDENITHDTEERSLGAAISVEYLISESFFLSARYMKGLNHVGIGQRSDIKEFKYDLIQLSAGITFR
jgi:hypothetical protein